MFRLVGECKFEFVVHKKVRVASIFIKVAGLDYEYQLTIDGKSTPRLKGDWRRQPAARASSSRRRCACGLRPLGGVGGLGHSTGRGRARSLCPVRSPASRRPVTR